MAVAVEGLNRRPHAVLIGTVPDAYTRRVITHPVTLAESAIAYTDDQHVVWHGPVVLGPSGVVVINLEVYLRDGGSLREQPAWQLGGPPPIDAYIIVVGQTGPLEGSFSNIRENRSFHFTKWFQPVEPAALVGAVLHLKLHPLEVDLRIELGTGMLGR
jgi:hypothetical protein